MDYKIVFFDVDGTLVNYEDGRMQERTRTAIQQLKDKGIHIVAATGRPLSMCQDLRNVGIETFITANGAYVKHQDQVIHKIPIAKEVVQVVKAFADENKQSLSFFTETLSMNNVQEEETLKAMKETLSLREFPVINEDIGTKEVYLMCLYGDEDVEKKYTSTFPHLLFKRWHPNITNVLQHDVSKSIAVQAVLEYFDLSPDEALAFGDGDNDIDMLEQVGFGIAMGNGSEALKNIANFVTKKSTEDGIDYALRELGII
ncbi:HAD family hydrolase [Lysinibacillus sp. KCTC 33748]|uniref:Cof-type HAD-IIB family hydrolase n=1 Tax=unclassified Lysinibacillus TaxID=2636778 RepID=UPI0009A89970|nr:MULTISPECIES: Cof-type HAD-IIB family hydrolase [unclassified Lysinibacillus]OXS72825.1 HAD family hydrolase [Lysinibacillus sp. KCTC 33748]SKB89210.1 Cof subfamily of IIB subfamily of haloacid dehalogenase superfamily/HAD-superfamily hydrolase, subfamily IIB [Lysinibacillus sp. AC-3]